MAEPSRRKRRREDKSSAEKLPTTFRGELRSMMYGFGDSCEPLEETIDLMDSLVKEYIFHMTRSALALKAGKGPITQMQLLYLVHRDTAKFERAMELLSIFEELKDAGKEDLTELAEEPPSKRRAT
eukprot:PLAT749.1.p1 GENE.PLAT749.1~~PLAT749.1.p1  ORF type:complete len:126 (+),score=36.37 PLAT749.1:41-418(+)